jgi:TatD DNase family protein
MTPKYVDVHCHPFIEPLKAEQDAVIQKMKEEGIVGIIVGVDEATSREAIALAEKYDHLYATIGLHPNDTPTKSFDTTIYGSMVTHPKVVAIGECGIDYFRIAGDVEKEKARQWKSFEAQVALALASDKPMMIHCRPSKGSMDSYLDMLDFLEPRVPQRGPRLRGNIHFFVGNLEVAKRFWAIGFTTSYTGVLTFTHDYDGVVKAAPLTMLLTETDAPFAAPMPHRGQTNYPSYVPLVVSAIASIRGEDEESVREALFANARRVFGL